MPSRMQDIRTRLTRAVLALTVVTLGTACQTAAPRTAPEPAVSALIVRNPGRFDVNLYTIARAGAKPVWLGTVAAATTRAIALQAGSLQSNNTLVVQARAIGSSRSWTSSPVAVGGEIFAVLDLAVDGAGGCLASQLSTVNAADVEIVMEELGRY